MGRERIKIIPEEVHKRASVSARSGEKHQLLCTTSLTRFHPDRHGALVPDLPRIRFKCSTRMLSTAAT